MSADIGKGDWVQAVRTSNSFPERVFVGSVHCVDHVISYDAAVPCPMCGDEGAGIVLVGDPPPAAEADGLLRMGWCRCFFRPLRGPSAEPVEQTTAPAPREPVSA